MAAGTPIAVRSSSQGIATIHITANAREE